MGKTYKENKHGSKKDHRKPSKKQDKQNGQEHKKWKFTAREEAEIYDDMKL
jgi:hypothetical protein